MWGRGGSGYVPQAPSPACRAGTEQRCVRPALDVHGGDAHRLRLLEQVRTIQVACDNPAGIVFATDRRAGAHQAVWSASLIYDSLLLMMGDR